ncbi:MAG: C1 family peptidase [Elusimicrobia bacterium]|nr:C1 family peptidase [Elusimicrobiota bacterium]
MKNLKTNLAVGSTTFLLLALSAASFAQSPQPAGLEPMLVDINSAIQSKGAKWVAGETSLSRLSWDEWMKRVGTGRLQINVAPVPEMDVAAAPPSLDWRDHDGDYVTPARDQKKCGSCWAFAMTGGLESYILVNEHKPGKNLDLSEQVFVSCSGTGSCNGGTLNAGFLKSTGLPPEKYYPYTATDGDCSTAQAGWEDAAYKVSAWGSVAQKLASMKSALAKYGPLPTAMMVYEDFMHYKSGIYSYATGKRLGGHAILLVGYNDDEQYFIVKNSWGTGWGEDGFFKIAYSEIDSRVDFGLSTIAYRPAAKKDPRRVKTDESSKRMDPLLKQKP